MTLAPVRPDTTSDPAAGAPVGTAIRFVGPIAGHPGEREFVLGVLDPDGLLLTLQSRRTPSLRFLLTPAQRLFGGYHPVVAGSVVTALHAEGIDDVEVLVLLTAGHQVTANLRAPMCVARSSGLAKQVLLEDETLSMRFPLTAP